MRDVYRGESKICRAKAASSFHKRALGLMFRARLSEGEGLLIEFSERLKSRSIHSFFMRFTIDLIFIGGDMKVVDTTTLSPWRIYDPKQDCRWVLEVPEGTVEKEGIRLGDVIRFEGPS